MHPGTPGQLVDALDRLAAALGDDIGGAEVLGDVGPGTMAAEDDDLLGPEPVGGEHSTQADSSVADDRDSGPLPHARALRGVMAGGEDVGERQERGHQRVVLADRQGHQRPVGQRNPHCLALTAVDIANAPEPAVPARGG